MSYKTKVNVLTKQVALTAAAGYVEVYAAGALHNMFGVINTASAMNVCVGPAAVDATDAASVEVAAGTSFELNTGIAGVVSVKVAADSTLHAYGA